MPEESFSDTPWTALGTIYCFAASKPEEEGKPERLRPREPVREVGLPSVVPPLSLKILHRFFFFYSSTMLKDKEAFQRLSFLYQAAHCVLAQNPENQELARFYCHTQNNISRRLVLRQDPSVKRTICKSCFSLLVPGISSTVRQRKRRNQRWTSVQCLNCGLTKRFLSNPEYKLWSEQPEALLENQMPATQGAKGQTPSSIQQRHKVPQVEKAMASSSGPHGHPTSEETAVCTKPKEKKEPSGK